MPESGTAFAICAPSLFDGAQFLRDHCVVVREGTVERVLPMAECPGDLDALVLTAGTLAPGLIDLQVNGGGDLMFNNNPCAATLVAMLDAHRPTGTTAMMPTFISDTRERQQQAVAAVRAARAGGQSGILGVHLEGPHFDVSRRGAHQADMIRQATAEDIAWLCSLRDLKVIVTLAPEHALPGQIRALAASGVHVCAGHTNASYEQIMAAVAEELARMAVGGERVCGKHQTLEVDGRPMDTFSLMLHALAPEQSLRLQRSGLRAHRLMGCGIFVPHKSAAAVGA